MTTTVVAYDGGRINVETFNTLGYSVFRGVQGPVV